MATVIAEAITVAVASSIAPRQARTTEEQRQPNDARERFKHAV